VLPFHPKRIYFFPRAKIVEQIKILLKEPFP
jgi:hypothetical protein